MIDLRKTFDQHRILWRDRGKNVSQGNLVISCPWCNKTNNPDRGEHLAISNAGEYFCYRNPGHKGMSIFKLFSALGIPYKGERFKEIPRTQKKEDKDFGLIKFFEPAEKNQEALDYLESRLFSNPSSTCKRFKLLTDREGKWAGYLIIPLTVGWLGRAMRDHIELRYDAYTTEDGFFLHQQDSTSCIIVEGSIDAMRIVSVSSQFDVVGKCGNRLSPALLNHLITKKYLTIYNVPDGDVDFTQYFEETNILRSYCTYSQVKRFQMPTNRKDFGAMDESWAREYLIAHTQ